MFVTALLPENAALTAVNKNEQHIEDTAAGNDPMKVRLRVDAPGNPQAVRFLHVLQGADAGADGVTAIKSEDGAFEGAVVRGTAVHFPVNLGAAHTQLAYVAPAGVTRHLITGRRVHRADRAGGRRHAHHAPTRRRAESRQWRRAADRRRSVGCGRARISAIGRILIGPDHV